MFKKVVCLFALLILAAQPVFADCAICRLSHSDNYGKKVSGKLLQGIGNVALGWTEIFKQPVRSVDESNIVEGIGKGIAFTAGRTAGGALNTATFLLPEANAPIPEEDCPFCALKD